MYIKQVLQTDWDSKVRPRLRGAGFTERQLEPLSAVVVAHMDNDHPASPRGGVSAEEIEGIGKQMTTLTSSRFTPEQIEKFKELMHYYIH